MRPLWEWCSFAEELGYESAWVAEGMWRSNFAHILASDAMATTTSFCLGTSISKRFCPQRPHDRHGRRQPWTIFPSSALFWAWDQAIKSRWSRSTAMPYSKADPALRDSVNIIRTACCGIGVVCLRGNARLRA